MFQLRQFGFCLLLGAGLSARAAETNSLVWHKTADRVDADVRDETLLPLLQQIAEKSGWQIYVEPGTARSISAKFNNLSSAEALRMLLGNLNFTLSPQTNAAARLYVFSTKIQNATQLVGAGAMVRKHVSNELMVRVKPGTDIDALAKSLGAKIVGRLDSLGIYLLQFDDAADAADALAKLRGDSDVLDADYNYYFDPEPSALPITAASLPQGPVSLKLDPQTPGDPCNVVIGLIDTPMDSLGATLDQFLLKAISVADNSGSVTSGNSPTHATGMAETILRAISQSGGGSSSARILPVDVYGAAEMATTWNVALGIQAAVNNGANILNLSLGGSGDSPILDSVIQQAIAAGIPIFAAAGNTPVNTPTYPAAISGVNAVTALQQPGQIASYANYGNFVDMALPGASIIYLGNQPYLVEGTSVSTAYATGVASGSKTANCESWPQIQSAMQQQFPVPSSK